MRYHSYLNIIFPFNGYSFISYISTSITLNETCPLTSLKDFQYQDLML